MAESNQSHAAHDPLSMPRTGLLGHHFERQTTKTYHRTSSIISRTPSQAQSEGAVAVIALRYGQLPWAVIHASKASNGPNTWPKDLAISTSMFLSTRD